MPFNKIHEAISSEIPSGTVTNFSSGIICFSEYPLIGADA